MTAEERIAELEKQKAELEKQKKDLEDVVQKKTMEIWNLEDELTKSKKEAENWRRMVTERNVRF